LINMLPVMVSLDDEDIEKIKSRWSNNKHKNK